MRLENIKRVAVIGAGIMGEGMAQGFAQAGLMVKIFAQHKESLSRCLDQIGANLRLFSEFNLLQEEPSSILSRIELCLANDIKRDISDCQFIAESIPEVLSLKRELFAQLDSCSPEIILSSNTSSYTMSIIAEGMHTPERVVGLHYFMPAHIIPLVEIHRCKNTTDEVVEVTRKLMLKVGKKPILVRKEIPGFIVNRISASMGREIHYLIEQGIVTPEDLDMAAKASYGFRLASLGPVSQMDISGLDTIIGASKGMYKSLCSSTEVSPLILSKVNKGEKGLKTGKGFYDWTGKSRKQVIEEMNRNLLKQLVLFKELEG